MAFSNHLGRDGGADLLEFYTYSCCSFYVEGREHKCGIQRSIFSIILARWNCFRLVHVLKQIFKLKIELKPGLKVSVRWMPQTWVKHNFFSSASSLWNFWKWRPKYNMSQNKLTSPLVLLLLAGRIGNGCVNRSQLQAALWLPEA